MLRYFDLDQSGGGSDWEPDIAILKARPLVWQKDGVSVWSWLPWRWVCRRPWSRHPAWVEEVGLEISQVSPRRKSGAEMPLARETSFWARVLEGEQAGGGGEAEGFWVTGGDWREGRKESKREKRKMRGTKKGKGEESNVVINLCISISVPCSNICFICHLSFIHTSSHYLLPTVISPPQPTCIAAVVRVYISTARPQSTPLTSLVSLQTFLPLHVLSKSVMLKLS